MTKPVNFICVLLVMLQYQSEFSIKILSAKSEFT